MMLDGSNYYTAGRFATDADARAAAAEADERQKAIAAQRLAKRQLREAQLKTAFEAAGGSEEEWAKEKAAILAADRRDRTLQADVEARRATGELYKRI